MTSVKRCGATTKSTIFGNPRVRCDEEALHAGPHYGRDGYDKKRRLYIDVRWRSKAKAITQEPGKP